MCSSLISATSIANTTIGVILGIGIREAWDLIRRPLLKVSFNEHDAGCKAHSPVGNDQSGEAYYIRAKVINARAKLAKSCRAFLIDVRQRNARGDFVALNPEFDDSLALTWSSQPEGRGREPIDIPAGVSLYIDILSTHKGSDGYQVHALLVPFRYSTLLDNKPKVLQLTILVTGDDARQGVVKVVFDWRGKWDTFDVAKG